MNNNIHPTSNNIHEETSNNIHRQIIALYISTKIKSDIAQSSGIRKPYLVSS